MARRAVLSSPEQSDNDDNNALTRQSNGRVANPGSPSPSPAASFSSDKENRRVSSSRPANGKSRAMPPPSKLPTPDSTEPPSERATKRRRLSERDAPNATQAAHEKRLDSAGDTSVYDPDQSIEERRAIRKDYRDLSRELTGRNTWMITSRMRMRLTYHRFSRRISKANLERLSGDPQ